MVQNNLAKSSFISFHFILFHFISFHFIDVVVQITKTSSNKHYRAPVTAANDSDASMVMWRGTGLTHAIQHIRTTLVIQTTYAGAQTFCLLTVECLFI